MRQASTSDLFGYWNALRGSRKAPDRSEINPGEIRASLPDVFLLGLDAQRRHPFRLAGTMVCALFGRELRGTHFSALWSPAGEIAMTNLVQCVIEDFVGAVTAVTGRNQDGAVLDLEMILLPLTCHDGMRTRLIGAIACPRPPFWFGIRPVLTLQCGDVRFVGPEVETAATGRFVAGGATSSTGGGYVFHPAEPQPRISRNISGLTVR
jgi:hypothetical protein